MKNKSKTKLNSKELYDFKQERNKKYNQPQEPVEKSIPEEIDNEIAELERKLAGKRKLKNIHDEEM